MTKIVILVIIYIVIFIHDIPKLKKRESRTIFAYAVIMIIAVYQSMIFAFDLPWPFLHDVVDALFGDPARRIVESLKVPPT
jgi:hypothetical protein